MSVLVKGMEMPKSCRDCGIEQEGFWCGALDGYQNTRCFTNERREDCPLVEVPDDVQPVVHGEWKDSTCEYSYYNYDCSVCGCNEYRQIGHNGKCKLFNYCPNCGAKMDGET